SLNTPTPRPPPGRGVPLGMAECAGMTIPPRRRDHARLIRSASRRPSAGGGRRSGGWGGPSFVWIAVVTIALGSLATAILLDSPKSPTSGLLGSAGGWLGSSAGIAAASTGPFGLPSGSGPSSSFGSTGPGASNALNGPVGTVPIVDFRSTLMSVRVVDVRAVLNGHQATFSSLELAFTHADPIPAAVGVGPPGLPSRLILAANAAAIDTDLAA